ncbi:MAG: gamma subclass chorismate mutase AroQ [Gammaproteobacteria bacterium]
MRRTLFVLFAALCTLAGCARVPPAPAAADLARIDRLLALVDARLALAPEVARAKWVAGAPIDDPDRERLLLERTLGQARAAGLDGGLAADFLQAQIDASKAVQRDLFERWRRRPPAPGPVPDLQHEVRPRLDTITRDMIGALREVAPLDAGRVIARRARAAIADETGGTARAIAIAPLVPR